MPLDSLTLSIISSNILFNDIDHCVRSYNFLSFTPHLPHGDLIKMSSPWHALIPCVAHPPVKCHLLFKEILFFSDTSCSFLGVLAPQVVHPFIMVFLIQSRQVHVSVLCTFLEHHCYLCFINALFYLVFNWHLIHIC